MAATGTSSRFGWVKSPWPNSYKVGRWQILVVGILLVFSISGLAGASATTKPTGLQIYPLRSRPTQYPGATSSGSITVKDDSPKAIDVTLSVERFQVTDEDYNYDFSPSANTSWVRLADKQIHLKPSEAKNIAYSLAVPINASPGGYYFAIFASTTNPPIPGSFTEVKRVASLVYLEVSGRIKKKVELLGTDAPWFVTKRQIPTVSRLSNSGNSHYPTRIKLYFTNLISQPTDSIQKDGLILPSTIRRLSTTMSLPRWPGVYHLNTEFTPPQGGEPELKSSTVIYLPIWTWIVYPLVLGYLIYKVAKLKRSINKRYKTTRS